MGDNLLHTRNLTDMRDAMAASVVMMVEMCGAPRAELHRSVVQHVFVIMYKLEELLGQETCSVWLHLATARHPFILISKKPAGDRDERKIIQILIPLKHVKHLFCCLVSLTCFTHSTEAVLVGSTGLLRCNAQTPDTSTLITIQSLTCETSTQFNIG